MDTGSLDSRLINDTLIHPYVGVSSDAGDANHAQRLGGFALL